MTVRRGCRLNILKKKYQQVHKMCTVESYGGRGLIGGGPENVSGGRKSISLKKNNLGGGGIWGG